ncbi:MAG: thiamine pyrophosphate-dependent dehydrogenase E1 component subunit alpha [Desulfovibrionaceae bacterium]|nr:thiamine pyrophosphate-dependent dehydrogenase E1 component subunit alpha [Desulfovibrionaceae bacterium]MBF0514102.1 thiamine pyrophosphate-dependent dehydrogenase E1 component subunit alpha [Desulfovibrionaceae bacterium]
MSTSSDCAPASPAPSRDVLRGLLETMLFIRLFEEKIVAVYPDQDMKCPVHLCIGQEAVAAGVIAHLRPGDYLTSTHRNHGHCLAKGVDPGILLAEFFGRASGCCRGKGGSMHPMSPEHGILGTSAIVGGGIPHGVGHALAAFLRGQDAISAVFFGDGASEEGSFHESLNFAALKGLPVVFVCENNHYATNSPLGARQPNPDVHRRAQGYGIPAERLDGNDVEAVYAAAGRAAAHARAGLGPYFLECVTYRWKGHVGPDCDYEKGCRPKDELFDWMERCPVKRFQSRIEDAGIMDAAGTQAMIAAISARLDAAVAWARGEKYPDAAEAVLGVYAPAEV